MINTLDGFNLQPRLSIPFDGPIDVSTVSSHTVFLISLGSTVPGGPFRFRIVGINQVVWDPATFTLHAESDELLDQHTRYALVVTSGVRDLDGDAVRAAQAFDRFRHDLSFGHARDEERKAYRKDLLDGLGAGRALGVHGHRIVGLSIFTTQSATSTLEKVRAQIKAPDAGRRRLRPGLGRQPDRLPAQHGLPASCSTARSAPRRSSPTPVPAAALGAIPGAVATVAFGKYVSPDYEVAGALHPADRHPLRKAGGPGRERRLLHPVPALGPAASERAGRWPSSATASGTA